MQQKKIKNLQEIAMQEQIKKRDETAITSLGFLEKI